MAFSQKGVHYDGRAELPEPTRRALDDVLSQVKAIANQVNATPAGKTPAPPKISSLSVTAADGYFEATIQDNGEVARGIKYFLEYSLTASFNQPTVVELGTTRNWRRGLGNLTLYWRAYSQYQTSEPSEPVYFGGPANPTAVVGGGSAGPTPHPSAGSGTTPSDGLSGGQGYGRNPSRSLVDRGFNTL